MQAALENQQEWMKHFLVYKDREEIDRIMLTMLVKRICVDSKKKAYHTFFGLQMNFERLDFSAFYSKIRCSRIRGIENFLLREGEEISA